MSRSRRSVASRVEKSFGFAVDLTGHVVLAIAIGLDSQLCTISVPAGSRNGQ